MGTELINIANFCTTCGQSRNNDDRFCGQCGREFLPSKSIGEHSLVTTVCDGRSLVPPSRPLAHAPTASSAVVSMAPSLVTILNNRWIVIGLLAAVGPIGLPALWFSPRFKPWVKLTISIFYFLLTAIVPLVIAWYWLDFALRPIVDIF